MIKVLTEKYQKQIAWLLLFTFYGEIAASLHANDTVSKYFVAGRSYNYYTSYYTGKPLRTNFSERKNRIALNKTSSPTKSSNAGKPGDQRKIDSVNIGGPGQPEMSRFKSVGADNMVNLFTGDFSYNIPLLDVGGYPVNLFYNGGVTMDQEASWVGLGWNINPGTITRNMRGLPDDFNGYDSIKKIQSIQPDVTVGVTGSTGAEIVGVPGLSANISAGIFYNNRRGLGLEAGVRGEFSVQKMLSQQVKSELTKKDTLTGKLNILSGSAGLNLNSQQGLGINANFAIYAHNLKNLTEYGLSTSIDYSSRQGLTDLSVTAEYTKYKWSSENADARLVQKTGSGTLTSSINFARSSFTPSIRMPLTHFNKFYSVKIGTEKKVFFKNGVLGGYVNESRIDPVDMIQKKPAYGFMYYEKASKDKNALMDFNRLNDGVYTYKTPVISVPVYTYDVFSINGEGTGGSFRGYRGNMGYVRDHYTKTRSSTFNLSFDVGPGDILHLGAMFGDIETPTIVDEWKFNNALRQTAAFKNTDSIFQSFYFKNPGEKAIIDQGYYNSMGGDQLIRPYLFNTNSSTPTLASGFQVLGTDRKVEKTVSVTSDSYRKTRDKRTQVITYLTAEEADLIGLDKYIYSYAENVFQPGSCKNSLIRTPISRYNRLNPGFYRKAHHISEVDVLESDGKRYVYGIPVYEIKQKDVVFSIDGPPDANQLISYNGQDNSKDNKRGLDHLYQSEEISGYAHSFLLTGILSPDYVDVTDDGITDDDLGTAIKFDYSRVNGQRTYPLNINYWEPYRWRLPIDANKANYNEGLKTDKRDDKALYTYGEKELWYLHSVESKNMVATFHISYNRNDGKSVAGENGGINNLGQRLLDHIDLYTKADYLKYGANARPIKTIHFAYSYKLCQGFKLNPNTSQGKLTLDSLWFSYNGNQRQKKNKYVFSYSGVNPAYNSSEQDRWGNYKDHIQNPQSAPNRDYPYTLQDSVRSNQYATAWNLENILLPSGAAIHVNYEADDYAYVQDKRACQMVQIAGFGSGPSSSPSANLYTGLSDHRYVFFNVTDEIPTRSDISTKYLQDFTQLLMKLWVKMPSDNIGSGYEPVTIYGAIKSYGFAITGGTENHHQFYVELEETKTGGSPIMETVIQFLKDFLPGKAYPGSVNTGNGFVQLIRSVWGMMNGYFEAVLGFEKNLKLNKKCREVNLNMSFARLNNPKYKKIGGGYRVKEIIITDNWARMTKKSDPAGLPNSTYGQQYDYTTTEVVNGQQLKISSGVASYEPGVGNEENPFRQVLKYSDKQPLGPTNHDNVELPVAETFFPAPLVGYRKVSVRSIHNRDSGNYKSGIGLQVTEFFTAKDFPVTSDFTSFDKDSRRHYKPTTLQRIFSFERKDYLTLTQGFRVVVNDMHGKLKSQTSYPENDLKNPVNYTEYFYKLSPKGSNKYTLDNNLPVISGPDGKISNKIVGRDVEVINDFRDHFTYTTARQIPINTEIFSIGLFPIIIPTMFRMMFKDESMYRSATTLKLVNEYGILDSVLNIDKGSVVSTKNLVYDAETGDVLISRTNNEFNKPVYQFNYPAWWVHTGMEPAYRNIDLVYKGVTFRNGRIEESPLVNVNHFESGDEIYLTSSKTPVNESQACVASGFPPLLPVTTESRIWCIDVRKDLRNSEKQFIFIDRYGNPCNATNATIRIIRSGKRNLAGASAASVVSLSNPIRIVNNEERVVIDDATDVINSGAVEFKEKWRANDLFYAKDTTIVTTRLAPVHDVQVYKSNGISNGFSIGYYRPKGLFADRHHQAYPNPSYFMARQFDQGSNSRDAEQKSWLLFDFGSISASDIILSAKLSLYSDKSAHTFNVAGYNAGGHNNTNPHVSDPNHSNDFFLHRMFTPWPSTNDYSTWLPLYDLEKTGGLNEVFVKGTPPWVSTKDYKYDFATNTDNRIEVTNLVKGMLQDRTLGYATGIKISLVTGGKQEARVCFTTLGGHGFSPPFIDLKYYNCSEAYGLPGNPSSPPLGQETAQCVTSETGTFCFSVFSKKQMNPYVEGVLGNFRAWKSYVYFGERRETDPTASTDIRRNGIINNFVSYWAFNDVQLARTNNSKWVWNSEITQYNRKGAELENRDPLFRYNSGIYGYQESLPIAVVNNSRLRFSAYDGFEDYFYKDDPCEPYCKPSKRHFNLGDVAGMLVDTQSHTGNYSLKIPANSTYTAEIKVSDDDTTAAPDIRIKLDSIPVQNAISVTPNGIGLKGYYYANTSFSGTTTCIRTPDYPDLLFRSKTNDQDCKTRGNLPSCARCGTMSVRWKGSIQVVTTGTYEFSGAWANDFCKIYVNNVLVCNGTNNGTYTETRTSITLTAGTLYDIRVELQQLGGYGEIHVVWRKPGDNSFSQIPLKNLYPEGQEGLANGTTVTQTIYCVKPDTIQAVNHHLIDSFNLTPNGKMVVSVWVKKGGQDCKCTGYDNISMNVKDANNALIESFKPKERIIEGWQQFEAIFTVPQTSKIKLEFNAPSDVPLFIDDLRLHPFNANMKSFVYDPLNLRLAAELDENNYASFYEYDDEGTLVRVKKETRAGIKTISETRSGLQKTISDF